MQFDARIVAINSDRVRNSLVINEPATDKTRAAMSSTVATSTVENPLFVVSKGERKIADSKK